MTAATPTNTNAGITVQITGALKPCGRGPGSFSENARRIVWLDQNRTIVRIEFKNGNFYEGGLDSNNKASGFGILIVKTIHIFIGIFRKGQYDGEGTVLEASGKMYHGLFKDSWWQDVGIRREENGHLYRVICDRGLIQSRTQLELNVDHPPAQMPTTPGELISYEKESFVESKRGNSLKSKSDLVKRLFCGGKDKHVKNKGRYQITAAQVTESTGRFFYGTLNPATRKAEGFGVLITPHAYRAGTFLEGRLSGYGVEVTKSSRFVYLGSFVKGIRHGSALWIEGRRGSFFGPWKDDKHVSGSQSFFPRLEDITPRQPTEEEAALQRALAAAQAQQVQTVAQAVAQAQAAAQAQQVQTVAQAVAQAQAAAQAQQAQAVAQAVAQVQLTAQAQQVQAVAQALAAQAAAQELLAPGEQKNDLPQDVKQDVPEKASTFHPDEDGNVFEGKFKGDAPEGEGILIFADVEPIEGKWQNGEFLDATEKVRAKWNKAAKKYVLINTEAPAPLPSSPQLETRAPQPSSPQPPKRTETAPTSPIMNPAELAKMKDGLKKTQQPKKKTASESESMLGQLRKSFSKIVEQRKDSGSQKQGASEFDEENKS